VVRQHRRPQRAGRLPGRRLCRGSTAAAAPVAAVPEPQTYAMLLAGLVAIGGTRLSRRRRD
jgi:hypothetical protein